MEATEDFTTPAGSSPIPQRMFVTYRVMPNLEDWVLIISEGQRVLATRRGRIPALKAWQRSVFPMAHDRGRHLQGEICEACDVAKAWARG